MFCNLMMLRLTKALQNHFILLKDVLMERKILPNQNYEANKTFCPIDIEYKNIHVCSNDCILCKKGSLKS